MDYLVTVIVPVFKAEKYVERCAHALFNQSFRSIEYVFVDDCSPDYSIDIIQRVASFYPNRTDSIRYIRHFKNKGVAAARNTGLFESNGDFILFCDSDDWMECNAVQKMYEAAVSTGADIVWSDFYYTYINYEIRSRQKNKTENIECIKLLLSEKMHGGLWNKLVKRTLYKDHDITFKEGFNIWEDLRVCIQLFFYARNVAYLPEALYHYVQYNAASLCAGFAVEGLHDTIGNTESIICFLSQKGMHSNELNYLKLAAKRNLLVGTSRRSFIRWRLIYPEANKYILSYRTLPMRLRLVGWFAAHKWWTMVNFWIFFKKRI